MDFQRSLNQFTEYVQDAVHSYNARILGELQPGDLVEFDRVWYSHWGVYVGNEQVVHLTGDILFSSSGQTSDSAPEVRLENFWKIANGYRVNKNNEKDKKYRPLGSRKIVERAMENVGKFISYDVIKRNCEHFASYCRYGEEYSKQAENVLTGLAIGSAVVAVGGLLFNAAFGGDKGKKS